MENVAKNVRPVACQIGDVDSELVSVQRCVCGATFDPWTVVLSVYPDEPHRMSCCQRVLYAGVKVEVFEVLE